jgi:hydrogenase/urease accessory protein HupE
MKMKYLLVLSALMTLVLSPVFAHTGVNADHSKVKNLLLHLMSFDHLATIIGLGLCLFMGGQLLLSLLLRVIKRRY